jgi:hypothetical protein
MATQQDGGCPPCLCRVLRTHRAPTIQDREGTSDGQDEDDPTQATLYLLGLWLDQVSWGLQDSCGTSLAGCL